MSKIVRVALAALLAGIILGVLAVGIYEHLFSSPSGVSQTAAENVAPETLPTNVKLTDLRGHSYRFSHWHGRLLLVNFWASWCGPCKREIPLLIKMQKKYGAQGFQIVGPAVDTRAAARRTSHRLHIDYPVLTGTPAEMIPLMNKLGNEPGGLPFSVLVSPNGQILERHLGMFGHRELEKLIKANLSATTSQ